MPKKEKSADLIPADRKTFNQAFIARHSRTNNFEVTMAIEALDINAAETFATELLRARVTGKAVRTAVLPAPIDKESAMQIQALVQERLAQPVKGWKVALGPGQEPIAAPLLDVYSTASAMKLFPNCTIEVELAVRLGKDLPACGSSCYDRADIVDAIESVILGIEVIGGRFSDPSDVPFLSFLADNLGNRAYFIGDSLPVGILDGVAGLSCHVMLDDLRLHQAPAVHPAGDPLLPLLAYANRQSDCLGGLQAGQIVTTGTLCGVLPVSTAGVLTAGLEAVGQVSIKFAP